MVMCFFLLVTWQDHEDVVSAIAYSPLHPQLASGSYDGGVRFYTEESR